MFNISTGCSLYKDLWIVQNITNDSSCWCKIFSWIFFNVHLYKEFRIFCMQWKSLLLLLCIVLIIMMTFIIILWERSDTTPRHDAHSENVNSPGLINTKLFPRFSNTDVEKSAFPTVEKDRCDFHPGYWVQLFNSNNEFV